MFVGAVFSQQVMDHLHVMYQHSAIKVQSTDKIYDQFRMTVDQVFNYLCVMKLLFCTSH